MQGLTYFQAKGGTKRKASSLLDQRNIQEKLAICTQPEALRELPAKQHARINSLHDRIADEFPDWRLKLKLGFSLLFYGYGNKKPILDRFGRESCKDGAVLCINGWAPSLTIRSLLLKVVTTLRTSGLFNTSATGDSEAILRRLQKDAGETPLYLIIHGIDGPGLRTSENQAVLSRLAAIPTIRMAASIEHVNAPLLWDKSITACFNWLYLELTTFMRYHIDTPAIQPLLCNARTENQRLGALVVLQTLVPNARQIFKILAQEKLDEGEDSGMSLHELFNACRARFLVTNELALRGHLNEFRDHDLVHTRRSAEGSEEVYVPMSAELLEEILREIG